MWRRVSGATLLLSGAWFSFACASPPVTYSQAEIHEERSAGRAGALTEAEVRALDAFESEYGQVTSIYAEGSAPMAEWRALEPNNTQGLAVDSRTLRNVWTNAPKAGSGEGHL
jgi:hypothetical protein